MILVATCPRMILVATCPRFATKIACHCTKTMYRNKIYDVATKNGGISLFFLVVSRAQGFRSSPSSWRTGLHYWSGRSARRGTDVDHFDDPLRVLAHSNMWPDFASTQQVATAQQEPDASRRLGLKLEQLAMAYPVGEEQNLFWIKMTKMSSIKMKHLWLNGRSRLLAEEGTGGSSQAPYQTSPPILQERKL